MMLFKAGWQALAVSKLSAQIKYSTVLIAMGGLAAFVCVPRSARAVVHASIVVDAETGVVLHAQNVDHLAHPASLAKLMTLYITFERLDSGRLTLGQKLHISRHAASRQPARLGLRPGASISVRSAILAIVTKSANDAAVVLAEGISGSESRFARLMTSTARELGMQRTTFYNASGLPNRRQWTTARDMSTLALAIINDFPAYYHFFRVRSFRFHGRTIYGHDHLLGRYPGADGLKTGFIRASGYNLVTSAVRHQRRLVGVVLGGSTAASRDRHMITLLNHGFAHLPPATLEARADASDASGMRQIRKASARLEDASAGDDDSAADPEPDQSSPNGNSWIVQVGGNFSSARSVRRVLRSAILSAPSALDAGHELVVKLRGRRYRARFSQLSQGAALRACRVLRRKGYTCRVLNFQPSDTDFAGVSATQAAQSD